MANNILTTINLLFFLYLGIGSLYILIFSAASKFKLKELKNQHSPTNCIAVFIPVYAENEIILDTTKLNLNQNYPKDKFDLIVIADQLNESTIEQLKSLGAKVISVQWENDRTKAKSLNYALKLLEHDYQIAVVLDADNVMAPDVLAQFNNAYNNGWKAIQGHRKAKNKNTSFALLDGISEEINNSIFRKGHRILGLSSALIGSGMAFDYLLFASLMQSIHAINGFDKELELELLRNKVCISYLQDALILDEKIQRPGDFAKQRKRWIHAQIIHLKKNSYNAIKALFSGNFDFFDKVLQFFIPPRLLLLGTQLFFSTITIVLYIIFPNEFGSSSNLLICKLWLLSLGVTLFSLIISIPSTLLDINLLRLILQLPLAFFLMVVSLFKNKSAKEKFIHTKHTFRESIESIDCRIEKN